MKRLELDFAMLKDARSDLLVGPNSSYFILEQFHLPKRLFNREATRLLVNGTPTYPTAPPDNFYVSPGLRLADGAAIQNYTEPVELHGESWGQFSFHVADGGWNPAVDNFLTFLTAVRARLQEGA
jgi:hypothetical protein